MHLKINDCRGQCYDGASTMSGSKSGVAIRIKSLNEKTLYTHCYGHELNLSVKDVCSQVKCLKTTFDTGSEICKLVKLSPQRETHFKKSSRRIQKRERWCACILSNALDYKRCNFAVVYKQPRRIDGTLEMVFIRD